jgi:hypothetical protein
LCAADGPLRFSRTRDRETIDSELRLAAVRRVCREQDGVLPSIGPVDELLDERIAAGHLPHRCGTDQHPALRVYGWRVNHCATVTPPSCVPAARTHPVTDEHPARAEPMPARAVLRWPNHPSAISAAD